jgi:hypothetical protein
MVFAAGFTLMKMSRSSLSALLWMIVSRTSMANATCMQQQPAGSAVVACFDNPSPSWQYKCAALSLVLDTVAICCLGLCWLCTWCAAHPSSVALDMLQQLN